MQGNHTRQSIRVHVRRKLGPRSRPRHEGSDSSSYQRELCPQATTSAATHFCLWPCRTLGTTACPHPALPAAPCSEFLRHDTALRPDPHELPMLSPASGSPRPWCHLPTTVTTDCCSFLARYLAFLTAKIFCRVDNNKYLAVIICTSIRCRQSTVSLVSNPCHADSVHSCLWAMAEAWWLSTCLMFEVICQTMEKLRQSLSPFARKWPVTFVLLWRRSNTVLLPLVGRLAHVLKKSPKGRTETSLTNTPMSDCVNMQRLSFSLPMLLNRNFRSCS